jgi:hypothetical protein
MTYEAKRFYIDSRSGGKLTVVAMPKNKVCLHILTSSNGCEINHSYSRGIRTHTRAVLLMSSDTEPFKFRAAGQSQHKFYLSSINKAHVHYNDEIGTATGSSAILYMEEDVGFYHIHYVGGKVDNEAAANCRVEQTEEGRMLSFKLMSIGCTQSKGLLLWRRLTPKQLERLREIFGKDFYTKEDFNLEDMH